MSSDLSYRLMQFEVPPPPGAWNAISARLDEEYNVAETDIAEKIYDSQTPAPPLIWNRIADALNGNKEIEEKDIISSRPPQVVPIEIIPGEKTKEEPHKTRVVPFSIRRVAAIAVVFLAVGALYYFMTDNKADVQPLVNTVPSSQQAGLVPSAPQVAINEPTTAPRSTSKRNNTRIYRAADRNLSNDENIVTQTVYNPAPEDDNISYSNVKNAEQLAEEPISVPTQPILDKSGNMIMDEKLVSSPDLNYVTVTAPNGEQTKISKKFMSALGYMNSAMAKDDYIGLMLQEGSNWKWLFQEWRNKLLKQPSFIPTATNFLDIMELKEMLHENF